ncbi:YggN family protein [Colwellia piezophila]|uniref:YggN family protein n=1 Tax=Colwellia piezophila TaxID=211668 RepID=UPI00039C7BA5|nr:YggN family protein [Colwellia piezophila]
MPFSQLAYAQECSINLNYGLIINPKHIRIVEQGQTQVQINNSKQLFIRGREIPLSNEQQQLLNSFSEGIRQQVPEIVSIAIEGADIGLKAVNKVVAGLTGENSAAQQKVQAKFDEIKWRIRARFNQSANNYYIAPQDLNNFDKMFAGEFEQEIEAMISASIGSILEAVGQSMLADNSNNEYGGETRISTYDKRLTSISQGLELDVTERAKALDKKAAHLCQKLTQLDLVEAQLHQAIPALKNYNLIESSN